MVKQLPWKERTFYFDFSINLFPIIYYRLEGTIYRLNGILKHAGEEFCGRCSQGWSVKEHLGHLTDLEELWWKRLSEFRQKKPLLSAADMDNEKTKKGLHNQKTLEQLISEFTIERQKVLKAIYLFEKPFLETSAIHPRLNQSLRLIDLLYFVAEHDDHHLSKISTLLRSNPG